jgi:hypothetical protein
LEECGKAVDTLLILEHVLISTLAAFPDESLICSRDGPLSYLHSSFEELFGAFCIEEVLITCSFLALGFHRWRSTPSHYCPETVTTLIWTFAENAYGFSELAEFRLDCPIACGDRKLTLGSPLFERPYCIFVLLTCPSHILRCIIHNVVNRWLVNVA